MLNEEKIKYMTELAIFEKNEGKEIFSINRYFKGDYISGQMFRSFFGYTFSYLLILLLWVLYKLEDLMNTVSSDDLIRICFNGGKYYVLGLVAYLGITWYISSRRYDHASRLQIMYAAKLKHLVKRYDKTEKVSYKGGKTR